MNAQLNIILTSIDDVEQAKVMAKSLIEGELAACVQISPAGTSFYRWHGDVEEASEVFISIKTLPHQRKAVMAWLQEFHSYDTPEIVCLDATAGKAYGEWMLASVK